MASTCEHAHGASAPRPRRAAVRAGSHHAPASAAISASAWPPRRRPQLVTSLKRRPTKISEQNRNSEYEMHRLADAKNALTKPLALISFCYCFVSRLAQGRFYREHFRTPAKRKVTRGQPAVVVRHVDPPDHRGPGSLHGTANDTYRPQTTRVCSACERACAQPLARAQLGRRGAHGSATLRCYCSPRWRAC